VFLFALFHGISPAAAAWTSPAAVNGTLLRGEPSCVGGFSSPSQVVCAALSSKGTVVVSRYSGTAWTAWKTLAGAVSSPPSCTDNGAGKVVCAARAVSGQLQYWVYDPVANLWTAPVKVAGSALHSGPSCARAPGGKLLCAARSSTGEFTASVFDGVAWSAFASVAGAAVLSRPACTPDDNGGVVCAVVSPGTTVYAARYAAGAWGAFSSLGAIAGSGDIRCNAVNAPPWRVFCFVTGTDGFVYINAFTGTSWGGWSRFGELQTNYGVTCGVTSGGDVACGAIASSDNALYTTTAGTTWSGWGNRGGTGTGTPSCTNLGPGQAVCVFPGVDNKLYYSVGP
jgi:hypothetical protein